ncbi:YciI family protein [Oleiharenicola lentus]|uniref:YciI family protein n=1 Tax=Oleiharenicola lentus TaxID=2508720 RepID=UPI003F66B646
MRILIAVVFSFVVSTAFFGQTPASASPPPAVAGKLFIVHFTIGPAWDAAKPAPQQAHFKEHSANLARLRQAGLLVLGARYADKGMILLRVPDEAAVHAELAQDPAIAAGVFRAQVDEFRPFYHGSTQPEISGQK